jgi:phage-related protein (TIGR01555 family)
MAYRGDWLSRKVVDLPAFDACRAWRQWQAEQDQIEKIEEAERALGMQRKVMDAMAKSRLYGGSAVLIGVKNQKFEDELDIDAVGKDDLKFVHVVQRWMIEAGPVVRDITSPWFGEPEYYMRSTHGLRRLAARR